MGFWHTGYMDHHEADFFESMPLAPSRPVPPPVFPCPHCGIEMASPAALTGHLFDGHPYIRPLLLLRGRECGRARLTITAPTAAEDWTAVDCEGVRLNGVAIDRASLGPALAELRRTVAVVELEGSASIEPMELEFAIADPSDLDAIDRRLLELIRGQQLTMGSIQQFITATRSNRSAARYRDGIAIYLYGVLAREESPDSGLERHEYRSRFDEAAELLHSFDRPVADAICGLVAFHFNQFDEAMERTRSPRVSWAASRHADLLAGIAVDAKPGPPPERAGLDFVLSDAHTEQVLSWTTRSLGDSEPAIIDEMEASLRTIEPFDQLKVRVLCAEQARRLGLVERGLAHANELRHNPATTEWARTYVSAVKS
jgi:hypothetical protein